MNICEAWWNTHDTQVYEDFQDIPSTNRDKVSSPLQALWFSLSSHQAGPRDKHTNCCKLKRISIGVEITIYSFYVYPKCWSEYTCSRYPCRCASRGLGQLRQLAGRLECREGQCLSPRESNRYVLIGILWQEISIDRDIFPLMISGHQISI